MAEATAGKGKGSTPPPADEERTLTRRTILKRERVVVLPEDVTALDVKALREALGTKATISEGEAWVVVGEYIGASKREAIEAHAGKPGTPDAKPGDYKAPPVSGFSGGERYVRPDKPKVERETLED
jgi:hypothetical protein